MYIVAGHGQKTPGDKILMSAETSCHFGHLPQVLKESLQPLTLYTSFYDLKNVYSCRSAADNPRGQNFDVNRNPLVTSIICYKFKKNLTEGWFYKIFFMILYMYIAPGQGLTTLWGWNFDVNRNILSLRSFVASFQKISELWFYTIFFMILYMYIAPGQGQRAPRGTKFWCHQKCLVTLITCGKFKRNVFEVWFCTVFLHVYSLGAGGYTAPRGQSFDVNRNFLWLWSSVASFKS